jgi:N-acetylglucosaminyl-diphospho-decaprenol L-rhamnosyltransferase
MAPGYDENMAVEGGALRVAAVVVSYNTRDLLRGCLASLVGQCECVVVDNASRDGSADMVAADFPQVALIRNDRNLGFGAACNMGIERAVADGAELVLLLNSDARADDGAVRRLAGVFSDDGIVAAGGRLEHPDGRLQDSCAAELTLWAVFCEQTYLEKIFRGSILFDGYWLTQRLFARWQAEKEPAAAYDVAQVMGACLMYRPVERFDERFFLYCEDTELCKRLQRHGRIVYTPDARFVHELGASSSGQRWRSVAFYNRGKELYFAIHHGRLHAAMCWLLNRLGALLRLIVWGVPTLLTLGFVGRFRRQAGLFLRVLIAPLRGPQVS